MNCLNLLDKQKETIPSGPSVRNQGWVHSGIYHAAMIEDTEEAIQLDQVLRKMENESIKKWERTQNPPRKRHVKARGKIFQHHGTSTVLSIFGYWLIEVSKNAYDVAVKKRVSAAGQTNRSQSAFHQFIDQTDRTLAAQLLLGAKVLLVAEVACNVTAVRKVELGMVRRLGGAALSDRIDQFTLLLGGQF